MLGKLTLVAVLWGTSFIQAEHRSLPVHEKSFRPQIDSRVAPDSSILNSKSYQELRNILLGQLSSFNSQDEIQERIHD